MYNSYSALNLLGGMLYTVILLVVAYFVLKIVANWKILRRPGSLAGHPSSRSTATTSNSTFTGGTAGCF